MSKPDRKLIEYKVTVSIPGEVWDKMTDADLDKITDNADNLQYMIDLAASQWATDNGIGNAIVKVSEDQY